MRASEAEILVIPGLGGSGPDHWQSRWEAKIPAVRRVVQADWEKPGLAAWRDRIVEEVERAARPVVLVAHSLGALAAVHAAPFLAKGESSGKVKGGFLVAPPSVEVLSGWDTLDPAFLTLPGRPLPFPALVIASRDDRFASFAESERFGAHAWRRIDRRRVFRPHQQRKRTRPLAGRPDALRRISKDAVKPRRAAVTKPDRSAPVGLAPAR